MVIVLEDVATSNDQHLLASHGISLKQNKGVQCQNVLGQGLDLNDDDGKESGWELCTVVVIGCYVTRHISLG